MGLCTRPQSEYSPYRATRVSEVLLEGDTLKSPVSLPAIPPSRQTGHHGTDEDTHDGYYLKKRLPCWYAVTGYDGCSADLIEDPADCESVQVQWQGSCSQSTQTIGPRGTPARVAGKSGWFRTRTRS